MAGFKLAGLWSGTDKNGEFKLSGKSPDVGILIPPGARIQIFANQNRNGDRSPEYELLIFTDDQPQAAPPPPPAPRGYSQDDDLEAAGTPMPQRQGPPSARPAAPRPRPSLPPQAHDEEELEDPFAEDAPRPPRFAQPRSQGGR